MSNKIKVNHKNLVATSRRLQIKFVSQIESKLQRMSTAEIDKIPVIKVSEQHFNIVNNYAIVFSIAYPNESRYINIYYIGMVPYRFII